MIGVLYLRRILYAARTDPGRVDLQVHAIKTGLLYPIIKEPAMTFCTAINCMDGRTQLPVIHFLQTRFAAENVDLITEPGPNAPLADDPYGATVRSIESRLQISIKHHHSVGIAVVGHHDCAGNPADDNQQKNQTLAAARFLRRRYTTVPVIALWLDQTWTVPELEE